MVSKIVENIPNRFVSIQHYGLLKANKEITEESNGTTTITVELDTTEDLLEFMNQTYPRALEKLKEICEK